MKNPHIGSSFDSFLDEEGIREQAEDLAQKRALAFQIERRMKQKRVGKKQLAERMHTSRTQVDRLLDPSNNKVQLDTLQRAARALGKTLKLELA